MELDALLEHFFGTDDPGTLTQTAFAQGIDQLKISFAVECEPSRKFALWSLLETLGAAPPPAIAFPKHPQLKAAAEEFLTAAFRLERFGDAAD